MSIKRTESGWVVDSQPGGRGSKRFRKSFKTKAEAMAWEAWLKTQVNQAPDWQPERRDLRKLRDLIELWFTHHGTGLRNGESVKRKLMAMVDAMGNPTADRFTADQFAQYRSERLQGGTSPNTVNHEHAYLRSMFNELIRLGHWKNENPLARVRQFKIQQQEMKDLQEVEIRRLLQKLDESTNPHVGLIARICLVTGARWSEAEELSVNQVKSGVIEFARTKSGKNRGIPIDRQLEEKIQAHIAAHKSTNRIFGPAYGAFRKAIDAAAVELPKGQLSHVLRHTFASALHAQWRQHPHLAAHPGTCEFDDDDAICPPGTRASSRSQEPESIVAVDTWLTPRKRKGVTNHRNPLILLVGREGLEPPTKGL